MTIPVYESIIYTQLIPCATVECTSYGTSLAGCDALLHDGSDGVVWPLIGCVSCRVLYAHGRQLSGTAPTAHRRGVLTCHLWRKPSESPTLDFKWVRATSQGAVQTKDASALPNCPKFELVC